MLELEKLHRGEEHRPWRGGCGSTHPESMTGDGFTTRWSCEIDNFHAWG